MRSRKSLVPEQRALDWDTVGLVAGVDEAGRGPLAGPVVAAAVILDELKPIAGLNDSKKLTEKRREKLYDEILAKAYEEARALNPATRDKLVNEEIERKAKAAEKARKAASLNVASSDKPGRMSEYDRLSAAYDKAMSA